MSYPYVLLGDYIDILSGFAFKSKDFSENGIPVIKIKNIVPPYVTLEDLSYVPNEIAKSNQKYLLTYNDVLIALTGSHINQMASVVGRIARVKYNIPSLLNQRVGKITVKNEGSCDINYVYYFLSQEQIKIALASKAGGAANQANISPSDIKKLIIPLPPIETQRRIADILSAYDDLIENNRKQIKLLEEAAQRLYKEWFVDLHFPGHEHTKIVDGVPEGWRYGHITDISECFDSKRKPLSSTERDRQQKKFPYYGAASLMDYVEDYIFDGIYLLFGEDGTVITSEGTPVLQYVWGKFWVNNHAHIFQGIGQYSTEFLYMLCKYMNVNDVVTGVAQPKISRGRLNEKNILIPAEKYIRKYSAIVEKWFYKLRGLKTENELLLEARDRLLPKLMSGEVEV